MARTVQVVLMTVHLTALKETIGLRNLGYLGERTWDRKFIHGKVDRFFLSKVGELVDGCNQRN